jgi:hypothetical protein
MILRMSLIMPPMLEHALSVGPPLSIRFISLPSVTTVQSMHGASVLFLKLAALCLLSLLSLPVSVTNVVVSLLMASCAAFVMPQLASISIHLRATLSCFTLLLPLHGLNA